MIKKCMILGCFLCLGNGIYSAPPKYSYEYFTKYFWGSRENILLDTFWGFLSHCSADVKDLQRWLSCNTILRPQEAPIDNRHQQQLINDIWAAAFLCACRSGSFENLKILLRYLGEGNESVGMDQGGYEYLFTMPDETGRTGYEWICCLNYDLIKNYLDRIKEGSLPGNENDPFFPIFSMTDALIYDNAPQNSCAAIFLKACKKGNLKAVERLYNDRLLVKFSDIEKYPRDIAMRVKNFWMEAFSLAYSGKQKDVVAFLLQDQSFIDSFDWQMLNEIILTGNDEKESILFRALTRREEDPFYFIDRGLFYGDQMLKERILIPLCAVFLERDPERFIRYAFMQGSSELRAQLCKKAQGQPDWFKMFAFGAAVTGDHLIKNCISGGFDCNERDQNGNSIIDLLNIAGHQDLARWIFEREEQKRTVSYAPEYNVSSHRVRHRGRRGAVAEAASSSEAAHLPLEEPVPAEEGPFCAYHAPLPGVVEEIEEEPLPASRSDALEMRRMTFDDEEGKEIRKLPEDKKSHCCVLM